MIFWDQNQNHAYQAKCKPQQLPDPVSVCKTDVLKMRLSAVYCKQSHDNDSYHEKKQDKIKFSQIINKTHSKIKSIPLAFEIVFINLLCNINPVSAAFFSAVCNKDNHGDFWLIPLSKCNQQIVVFQVVRNIYT